MLSVVRFRWAACQLDTLENCLDYRTLQNALASLPKTLDETYARILRGIPEEHKQNATRILQFLTYSERPLRIEEAVDVIVVDVEGDQHFNPKYRMPNPREISCYCSSLVVVVSAEEHSYDKDDKPVELQLAHFSVKEYLTSDRLDNDVAQNFQEVVAKTSIAIVCLAYLLHLDLALPIKKIRERFPLAQYCARYWTIYAAVAESKDETLQGFIKEFFCYHRSSYRNCYSLYSPDRPWDDEPVKRGKEPASALYYASFGGLANAIRYLLSQGADVNTQGGHYGNALQAASLGGHDQIIELLLNKGADVSHQVMHPVEVDLVGLVALTTTTKVRQRHAVPGAHQSRRDLVPQGRRVRPSVQQQDRRAVSLNAQAQSDVPVHHAQAFHRGDDTRRD